MERREFTRVQIRSLAVVKSRLTEIKGAIEDLSLNGLKFKTPQRFDLGVEVQIRILLRSHFSELWVSLFGVVLRHEVDGIIIQFTNMSLDSYIYLRNVIAHRLQDECKVFDEFFAHMTAGSAKGTCAELEFEKLFNIKVDQQIVPQ